MVLFWLLTWWCHGLLLFTSSMALPTQQTSKSTKFSLLLGKTEPTRSDKANLSLIKKNSPMYHVYFMSRYCRLHLSGKSSTEDWKVTELYQTKHLSKDPGSFQKRQCFLWTRVPGEHPSSVSLRSWRLRLRFSHCWTAHASQKHNFVVSLWIKLPLTQSIVGKKKTLISLSPNSLITFTEVWLRLNFPSVFTLWDSKMTVHQTVVWANGNNWFGVFIWLIESLEVFLLLQSRGVTG